MTTTYTCEMMTVMTGDPIFNLGMQKARHAVQRDDICPGLHTL